MPETALMNYYDEGAPSQFATTFPWADREPAYAHAADSIDDDMNFAETAVIGQLCILKAGDNYRYGCNANACCAIKTAATQRNRRR